MTNSDELRKYLREIVLTYKGKECPPTPLHQAAHSCGNGYLGCVTPGHLSWKTRKENEADKILHGTIPLGEKHGRSKLKEREVIEILALKGKISQREIAKLYGVQQMTISLIHQKKNWTYLHKKE